MATETTLILFKTDCVQKKHVGEVLQRFEGCRCNGLPREITNHSFPAP